MTIIVLSILWILSIVGFFYALPFADFFLPESKFLSILGVTNAFVIVGVPLLAVILFSARLAFKTQIGPQWRASMWSFWLINLVSFILVGVFVTRELNQSANQEITIAPMNTNADTVFVKLADSPYDFREALMRLGHLQLSGDQLIAGNIHFNVRKSETGKFELIQKHYARGRDWKEANSLVEEMKFKPTFENDHTLVIPPHLILNRGEKWRAQRVELTLKVPQGKKVSMGKNMEDIHNRFALDDQYNHPWSKNDLVWEMGAKGMFCPSYFKESNHQEDYSFKNFSKIQIDGDVKVNITKGDRYEININGNKKYTNKVEVFMFDKTLNISSNKRHHHHRPIVVNITMPSLESLDIKDTDLVNVRGFKEKQMTVRHDSRDDLKMFVNVDSMTIKQSGRGDIDLNGEGDFLKATVTEDSKLNAQRYHVKFADLEARRSSRVELTVSESYQKETNSGGRINIEGEGKEIVMEEEEPEEMLSTTEQ